MVVNKSLTKILNSTLITEAPNYLNTIKKDVVYKKLGDLNKWYTKIIGLDEVKLYQDRVVNLQEKLLLTQERRRELGAVLDAVRKKSNDLQDQLIKVKRDDYEQFLALIKEESATLKEERDVSRMFADCDQQEREIFTAFSNAIRDSHEKQRAQLEYTKYFGLIISVTGSFLAFVYSSLKKDDLKRFIEKNLGTTTIDAAKVAAIAQAVQENSGGNDQKIKEMYAYLDKDNQKMLSIINKNREEMNKVNQSILTIISKNRKEIDKDNQKMLSIINRNHEETKYLLSRVSVSNGSASYIDAGKKTLNELPNEEPGKLILYGLMTILGLIVIRFIAS